MDADLQHPPESVPKLLAPLLNDDSHFSLGSRYIEGGGTKDWALHRQIIRCGVSKRQRPLAPTHVVDIVDMVKIGFFF
jgi:dolichol-phosphate mannosyltransferase